MRLVSFDSQYQVAYQTRNTTQQMTAPVTKSSTNTTTVTTMATVEPLPPLEPVVVASPDAEKVGNTASGNWLVKLVDVLTNTVYVLPGSRSVCTTEIHQLFCLTLLLQAYYCTITCKQIKGHSGSFQILLKRGQTHSSKFLWIDSIVLHVRVHIQWSCNLLLMMV